MVHYARSRRNSVGGLAALALFCASAWGQATTSVRGSVLDPQHATIPGATITLSNEETALHRTVTSDEAGVYQFLQIPPGSYTIRVEKPGFAALIRAGIELRVNTPAALDLSLEVGAVTEVVRVSAEATPLNTVNASVGNPFNETQVRQLPLMTRNVVDLLSLQPGVLPNGEAFGARRDQNNVRLDGVDVNDSQNAGIANSVSQGSNSNGFREVSGLNAALPIPLDSVQEFRVTVGGQGAEQGRSSGGQVSLITKSGSNQLHGSVYEFHRNTATAANTWFNNRARVKREPLVRNQFGASAGGRMVKDRAFFFFNYEQRIDASGVAQARPIPSETMRNGILTFALTNGARQTLTQEELKVVDPLGIGVNPTMLNLFRSYSAPNDPALGQDRGLNFSGLRFNAPFRRTDKAYVGKMDFNLDRAGKHTLAVRGTLADNSRDEVLAQFPGQEPASKLLDNSRGFAAHYTSVMRPTWINSLNFGVTRLGLEQSGVLGPQLSFEALSPPVNDFTRGAGRRMPVYHLTDDLTWIKGRHTLTTGVDFRFIRNDRFSYDSSFPRYNYGRGMMLGLGSDIVNSITDFIRQRSGDRTLALANAPAVVAAMGSLLGTISDLRVTYPFQRDGSAIPQGEARTRSFATNEYEFYVADSWRARRDLTLTFGLRYGSYAVPYERNGLQVAPGLGIDRYFAERVFLGAQGVPGNAMPNARLTYDLNGPANGRPGWYERDKNNFAPRFSFAYAPDTGGWRAKLLGKGSVIRGGAAVVYDRYGSDLVTEFDRFGSLGVATRGGFPQAFDFSTAPRFTGAFPPIPPAPRGGFPFTPPDVFATGSVFLGISPDLRTPYSILLNLNYSRQLKGNWTAEIGYAGRLSRKLLAQIDTFTVLTNFKDPISGQTWEQMALITRQLSDGGLTPAQVMANPRLVAALPFVENFFPRLANFYFPGSASANYFHHVYGRTSGSDLDALHTLDRSRELGGPNCIVRTGCHTFFAPQGSANPTWVNGGIANFQGGILTIRRAPARGFAFDFNYMLSHSIDNASAAESGSGQAGAVLQSAFYPGAFRGSSDFDVRHNVTMNGIYELPLGRGRRFAGSLSGWADQIVGGWQITGIMRYRSALPTTIRGTGVYNTSYEYGSIAVPRSNAPVPSGVTLNQNGNPAIFNSTTFTRSYTDQMPGQVGMRAILRLDDLLNFDVAVAKSFRMPFEGHRIQFRAEAFNAFNNVNFFNPSLRVSVPATFGEFQSVMPPRVMQFGLRYEF